MTKKEFRDRIKKSKLILDGATGSNLQKRGMPVGVCPEEWIIENSEVLKSFRLNIYRRAVMFCMHLHFREIG